MLSPDLTRGARGTSAHIDKVVALQERVRDPEDTRVLVLTTHLLAHRVSSFMVIPGPPSTSFRVLIELLVGPYRPHACQERPPGLDVRRRLGICPLDESMYRMEVLNLADSEGGADEST